MLRIASLLLIALTCVCDAQTGDADIDLCSGKRLYNLDSRSSAGKSLDDYAVRFATECSKVDTSLLKESDLELTEQITEWAKEFYSEGPIMPIDVYRYTLTIVNDGPSESSIGIVDVDFLRSAFVRINQDLSFRVPACTKQKWTFYAPHGPTLLKATLILAGLHNKESGWKAHTGLTVDIIVPEDRMFFLPQEVSAGFISPDEATTVACK